MPASAANPLMALPLMEARAVEKVSAPAPSADIAALTHGLAAGDEAAFREFHERYFNRLFQFLLVITRGQEDEAQEALQQTLLRVLRYARVFESEEVFWSWLKVLARSAARDAGRKESRYAALLERFTSLTSPTAPADDASDRLHAALAESLDELDPVDRQLLESKYLEGATVREISAHSGLTEKALESRLLRVRRVLRERVLEKLRAS